MLRLKKVQALDIQLCVFIGAQSVVFAIRSKTKMTRKGVILNSSGKYSGPEPLTHRNGNRKKKKKKKKKRS